MNNVDERGYPGCEDNVVKQFDGGDTAAIVGNLIALQGDEVFKMKLRTMRTMLIRHDGLVRHPDREKWYGQTDRFSRDQLIPILSSFVGEPVERDARQVFRLHLKNYLLLAWNKKKNGLMDTPDKTPDITGPEVWALWVRVLDKPSIAKLFLFLLDLETLAGSIIWRWFKPKTNRLCRNHMLVCLMGMKKYPTITMRLAFWLNNWDDLVERWRAHCEAVGEYPTAPLFKKALQKWQ